MGAVKILVFLAFLQGISLSVGNGVESVASLQHENTRRDSRQDGMCIFFLVLFLREQMQSPYDQIVMSILETAREETQAPVPDTVLSRWTENNKTPMCADAGLSASQRSTYLARTDGAIRRALQYISDNMEWFPRRDPVLALALLQKQDAKHGGKLGQAFDVSRMITQVCTAEDHAWASFCYTAIQAMQPLNPKVKESSRIDVAKAVLMARGNLSIGTDREELTASLNQRCQLALLSNCEIPQECQVFFRAEPGTMYMLTHQLLQRMFAQGKSCKSTRNLLTESVDDGLCAKMYMEAQLISELGYPELLRDTFGEYVAFCGFLGYSNFYRVDWLEAILSWQSEEVGCFPASEGYWQRFLTSESVPVVLSPNPKPEEKRCRTHLTSVQLMALTGFWDHLKTCQ